MHAEESASSTGSPSPTRRLSGTNCRTALDEDTKNAAIQLGKALRDPMAAIPALEEQGFAFSDAAKELLRGAVESGDLPLAQQWLLGVLGKHVKAAQL